VEREGFGHLTENAHLCATLRDARTPMLHKKAARGLRRERRVVASRNSTMWSASKGNGMNKAVHVLQSGLMETATMLEGGGSVQGLTTQHSVQNASDVICSTCCIFHARPAELTRDV
jgi:hypothetical protein